MSNININFINASHWQYTEDESSIKYISGYDDLRFHGFAWLQIDKKKIK